MGERSQDPKNEKEYRYTYQDALLCVVYQCFDHCSMVHGEEYGRGGRRHGNYRNHPTPRILWHWNPLQGGSFSPSHIPSHCAVLIHAQEDFHSFHWSIVFLAMGGIALGKATLSSGLLDDLDGLLERLVEGLGLYSILVIFSVIALVIATL